MTFRIALRYAFSKARGQRSSSIWISVGIAVGLIALIIISSTVNALQTYQLSKIRNVESFDITVKNIDESDFDLLSQVNNIDGIYKYSESFVLIENPDTGDICSARLRGVENSLFSNKRFSQNLLLNKQDEIKDNQICISPYLFSGFVRFKDGVKVTFFKKGRVSAVSPSAVTFDDVLTYSCSLSDFSHSTALMNLDQFLSFVPNAQIFAGIYTAGGNIENTCRQIKEILPNAEVISYKKYNSSLYSALLLEKTIIYVFLSFVFLIICTNLKGSTSRLINLKKSETSILRAIGMTKTKSNSIFLLQGFIISFIGVVFGAFFGFLLVRNIKGVFNFLDTVIYMFSGYHSVLSMGTFNAGISYFQLFVFSLGILCLSCLFTWLGIKKSNKTEVIENVSC